MAPAANPAVTRIDAANSAASARKHSFLAAGPVVVDLETRCLIAQRGRMRLERASFVVLSELLRRPGETLSADHLSHVLWPSPNSRPADARTGVRVAVLRARKALESVGLQLDLIQSVRNAGYRLDGDPRVVRVLTPAQAEAIDRLLPLHCNQAA